MKKIIVVSLSFWMSLFYLQFFLMHSRCWKTLSLFIMLHCWQWHNQDGNNNCVRVEICSHCFVFTWSSFSSLVHWVSSLVHWVWNHFPLHFDHPGVTLSPVIEMNSLLFLWMWKFFEEFQWTEPTQQELFNLKWFPKNNFKNESSRQKVLWRIPMNRANPTRVIKFKVVSKKQL